MMTILSNMWRTSAGNLCFTLMIVSYLQVNSSELYSRVLGGTSTKIEDVPYVVSLRYNRSYYCSGSILSNTKILTAAVCNRPEVTQIKVRVGSRFYSKKGTTIKAKEFISHGDFDEETLENNIAIIVLEKPIIYRITSLPVSLSNEKLPDVGELVTISGWGVFDPQENETASDDLRSVDLPVMSNSICQFCHPDKKVTASMFCAGYFFGGKGLSFDESGGPVIYNKIQYGVVSFSGGIGAYPLSPGVFMSTLHFRKFIVSQGIVI